MFIMLKPCLFILGSIFISQNAALLYPASSTLSLVSSVSVPITELLPDRRVIVDWCFNMGFSLPSTVSAFYNIPIWPGSTGHKDRRALWQQTQTFERNHSSLDFFAKYTPKTPMEGHPKDFSAGELYEAIEDLLVSYGFHETCLLRSVCELARHPFDDTHRNMLTEIITFLLTPTWHDGFLESEQVYKNVYEQAELHGFMGENCALIYDNCHRDILQILTKVIFS